MEWAILFTVVSLYAIKFYGFSKKLLEKPEPQRPFQRPTPRAVGIHPAVLTGRRRGEISLNDMTTYQLERFIAALRENSEYNGSLKRGLIPEKVNWKEEGF